MQERKNDPKDRAFNSELDHSFHLSLLLKRKETVTRHLHIVVYTSTTDLASSDQPSALGLCGCFSGMPDEIDDTTLLQ